MQVQANFFEVSNMGDMDQANSVAKAPTAVVHAWEDQYKGGADAGSTWAARTRCA